MGTLYKIKGKFYADGSGSFLKSGSLIMMLPNDEDVTRTSENRLSFSDACNSIGAYSSNWFGSAFLSDVTRVIQWGYPPSIPYYNEQLYLLPVKFVIDNDRYIRLSCSNSNYYSFKVEFNYGADLIASYTINCPTYNNGSDYLGVTIPMPSKKYDMKCPAIQIRGSQYGISMQYNSWGTATAVKKFNERTWNQFFFGLEPYDPDNPYVDGGTSTIGGGGGNFSEESDGITPDLLPSKSSIGTGFATLFTPSASQLHSLADVMWNSNIFTALQNLVENITDMFTSLGVVPFDVTAGGTVEVTWLGLPMTEIYLTLAAQQYYEIDMGAIDLANDDRIFTSGSALDYAPFSRLGIYLPFIGFQELDIDECRGCVLGLKYRIDILSGTCVAIISLNGTAVYEFTGNCLTQIPITSESMTGLVSDAVSVGIAVSSLGATGAVAGGEITKAAESKAGLQFEDVATAHRSITHSEAHLASATANAAMGMKPNIKKSGAVSASASLMSVRQPYLFLTTPRQCIPDHYQRYCGFPSNITGKLNEFSGYTVVEDIRLNDLVATSAEVAEIYELLKKGVII